MRRRQWLRVPAGLLLLLLVGLPCGQVAADDEEARLLRQGSVGSILSERSREERPAAVEPARPAPAQTRPGGDSPGHPEAGRQESGKGIRLFGTLEMRTRIGNLPKWTAVLDKQRADPGYTDDRTFPGQGTWKGIRRRLAQASVLEKARAVNALINKWPYRTDMEVWGVMDYWAAPVEFFQKSGDCEDFSIAKYFALRALGVPASQMRIVVLKDTLRNLDHAVAVVYADGDAWVLDNLSNAVLSHRRYSHYRPQFSVNEAFRWAHLYPEAS